MMARETMQLTNGVQISFQANSLLFTSTFLNCCVLDTWTPPPPFQRHEASPNYKTARSRPEPTVQPSWVVQPDAVCEVGGWTPDLSCGNWVVLPGGGQTEKIVH